jgi:hypothetical protein
MERRPSRIYPNNGFGGFMTGEEFTAVLQLVHKDLSWSYGSSKRTAGVVLRNGTGDPVKIIVIDGRSAKDTLEKLVAKFLEEGVKL